MGHDDFLLTREKVKNGAEPFVFQFRTCGEEFRRHDFVRHIQIHVIETGKTAEGFIGEVGLIRVARNIEDCVFTRKERQIG